MRFRLSFVALAAIVAVSAGSARATAPGANGAIVFSASPAAYRLESVAVDGTNQRRVTQSPRGEDFPAWSPDRSQIAFVDFGTGQSMLVVANADGMNARRLAPAEYAERPAWSPDGRAIAFVENGDVEVIGADGSGLRVLGPGHRPAWSPDGRSVAATSGHAVLAYDRDSGDVRTIATVPNLPAWPSWSPDGTQIAFGETTTALERGTIHVAAADGSTDHVVTDGFEPVWSPSGDRLAVLRSFYAPRRLDVVDLSGVVKATIANDVSYEPRWSPDGALIAYATEASGNALVVASADGAKRSVVVPARPDTYLAEPTWSPDSSRLLYVRSLADYDLELYSLDATTGASTQLTDDAVHEAAPAWSPDGSTLAVATGNGIATLVPPGSKLHALTHGFDAHPDWSPDGSQIVFERKGVLYRTRSDRARLVRLTHGSDPSWSPNGRTIAFADGGSIWTIRSDGSHRRLLLRPRNLPNATALENPRWSPTGSSLLVGVEQAAGLVTLRSSYVVRGRTLGAQLPATAEWSPDGKRIVAVTNEEGSESSSVVALYTPAEARSSQLARDLPAQDLAWQPLCTLRGSDGANRLHARGGSTCALGGNDHITGSRGTDRIFGGAGNDVIDVRGGGFDVVGCGPGNDTVRADRGDDIGLDCEHVHR